MTENKPYSATSLANDVADEETRVAMYRDALRVRMVEQKHVDRYAEQEMRCPTHICIGQEGVPAGVSAHLRTSDAVFSAHRSHGHYLSKGGDLKGMLAELYGRETGCARGMGGSQHLIDLDAGFMGSAPILASTISVAVGYAWAAKRRGEDKLVVVYFGDGATEEGAFHEAMNFAGVFRLPVLFVCENNLYSVHSKLDIRQPEGRRVCDLGAAHGVHGSNGDGNDIDEVWRQAALAVSRIRAGNGPEIMEFMTYRWKEHCGPNEDLVLEYRSQEEFDGWVDKDPVTAYRQRLTEESVLTAERSTEMEAEIAAEIGDAFDFAKQSAFPPPDRMYDFVYPDHEQTL
jgi:TPP-dependent pyruvate/acetoin dehydrogenase alpha subunit